MTAVGADHCEGERMKFTKLTDLGRAEFGALAADTFDPTLWTRMTPR